MTQNSMFVDLLLLAPLVFFADLLFLGGGEIVLDVERLSDLLGGFAFDHVGNRFAGDVEQALDVEVIGCQNEFEESSLVDFEELDVPGGDVVSPLLAVVVIFGRGRVVLVVRAPLNHFLEDCCVDVGERNGLIVFLVHAQVFEHGLDGDGELGDLHVHLEDLSVGTLQLDGRHFQLRGFLSEKKAIYIFRLGK